MSKSISKNASRQKPRRRNLRVSRPASFIQSSYGRRLRVETLEDRRLLAAVSVGNALDVVNAPDVSSNTALVANDGGDGISLREAIAAANNTSGADTITFDASGAFSTPQTITLGGTELGITETLTIDASSLSNNVEIDAQQLSRVLNFSNATGDLSLDGLTIKNGQIAARGGGIRFSSSGALSLNDSIVSGNQTLANASQDTHGGGIFSSTGNVKLNNSSVTGNQTDESYPFFGHGAGVATDTGDVTLTNSFVDNNTSTAFYGSGIGIFSSSGTITVNNSSVSGNRAVSFGDGSGAGIGTNTGTVSITDSTIDNNYSKGRGGGISVSSNSGQLTIVNSSISGNSADGGRGGGIYSYAPISITGSTINGNLSHRAGGGIFAANSLTLTDSTVHGNTAEEIGGGGLNVFGSSVITGSTISGNNVGFNNSSKGGGLLLASGTHLITNSTVSGNSSNDSGGGIFGYGSLTFANSTVTGNTSDDGGGIYQLSGLLTLESSIVAANNAIVTGPDFFSAGTISAHHSLVGDNSGSSLAEAQIPDANGNQIGSSSGSGTINPLLGPLANNGGATNTHQLLVGSPAVNAGDPAATAGVGTTPSFDQRGSGFDRVLNGRIDIGAFEGFVNLPVFTSPASASVVENTQSVHTLTATHADVPPPTITFALSGTGDDNNKFEIVSGNQLQFKVDPNFEQPTDVGGTPGDNIYVLTVQANDGTYTTYQQILVTVTDTIDQDLYVVDTTIDENDGDFSVGDLSLREAIFLSNNSSGSDTITFASGLSGQTITLGGTELEITGSVNIDASALASNVTVNANFASRALNFSSITGDLSLNQITVTYGRTTDNGPLETGAGIRFASTGTLSLTSSVVSNNRTQGGYGYAPGTSGSPYGGGIYSAGAVMLTSSTVSGNRTDAASGGGIFARGDVTLTASSIVTNNNAGGGSGSSGGGIWASGSNLMITDSTLSDNDASDNGGGIFTESSTTLTVTNSTLSGNTADDGGGVYASGDATITGSDIIGNNAGSKGGGVYIGFWKTLMLTDSTVSGNTSDGGGGVFVDNSATAVITGSTISGNVVNFAFSAGGGLYADFDSNVTLTGSTVSGNSVTGISGFASNGGGGIYARGAVVTLNSTTVTGNSTDTQGGGIGIGSGVTLNLNNSIVAGNTDDGTAPDIEAPATLNATYNLVGDNTGSGLTEAQTADANGNLIGSSTGVINPLLGTLQNNGGTTQTHELLAGSLGVDAGDPAAVAGVGNTPLFDQRGSGFGRVRGLRLDIGALEDQTNAAPLFTSPLAASVAENTQPVHTLAVIDDPSQTITFGITGTETGADILGPGGTLLTDETLVSADGSHTLIMQSDGNLVVYGPGGSVAWASATNGSGADRAVLQPNGNLQILAGASLIYETGSGSLPNSLARLRLQDNGQLSINRIDGAIVWGSILGSTSGGSTVFSPGSLTNDNDKFEIVSGNELQFKAGRDFENPTDTNGDNIYEVTVLADDGNGGFTPQTILVTVTQDTTADFDQDGDVDGFDFLSWQRGFGTPVPNAIKADGDANNDTAVDAADLTVWQSQFGQTVSPIVAASTAPTFALVQSSTEQVSASAVVAPVESAQSSALARSELVDVALALEWMELDPVHEEPLVVDEQIALPLVAASDRAEASKFTASSTTESSTVSASSKDEALDERAWLTDELLESVFG